MKMSTSANTISITANPFSSILRDLVLPAGGVMSSSPLGMKLGIDYLSVSAGTENSDYCLTHQHNAWVIVGSLEGHARVTRGSFCVDIAPGSVYIIPPSLSFQERNIGTTHWKWMVLMVYTTGDVPFLANFPYTPAVFQANVFFFEQFARLLMSVNQQEASDQLLAFGLLLELLSAYQQTSSAPQTGTKTESAFLACATSFMQDHLYQPISLLEVAENCQMSPSSFSHRFKAETGMTPMNWLTRARIAIARRLLLEGRTASTTAEELGFANPFHFSRVFTRIVGVAPSQFQRLSRMQDTV